MEIVGFLALAFIVALLIMWRVRSGGTGEAPPTPAAVGDRPEASISNESTLGPHRNVGRPWRDGHGDPQSGGRTEDL
jgi:hypothetical protein